MIEKKSMKHHSLEKNIFKVTQTLSLSHLKDITDLGYTQEYHDLQVQSDTLLLAMYFRT